MPEFLAMNSNGNVFQEMLDVLKWLFINFYVCNNKYRQYTVCFVVVYKPTGITNYKYFYLYTFFYTNNNVNAFKLFL